MSYNQPYLYAPSFDAQLPHDIWVPVGPMHQFLLTKFEQTDPAMALDDGFFQDIILEMYTAWGETEPRYTLETVRDWWAGERRDRLNREQRRSHFQPLPHRPPPYYSENNQLENPYNQPIHHLDPSTSSAPHQLHLAPPEEPNRHRFIAPSAPINNPTQARFSYNNTTIAPMAAADTAEPIMDSDEESEVSREMTPPVPAPSLNHSDEPIVSIKRAVGLPWQGNAKSLKKFEADVTRRAIIKYSRDSPIDWNSLASDRVAEENKDPSHWLSCHRVVVKEHWDRLSDKEKHVYMEMALEDINQEALEPSSKRVKKVLKRFNKVSTQEVKNNLVSMTVVWAPGIAKMGQTSLQCTTLPGKPDFEEWLQDEHPEHAALFTELLAGYGGALWVDTDLKDAVKASHRKHDNSNNNGDDDGEDENDDDDNGKSDNPPKVKPLDFTRTTPVPELRIMLRETLKERWVAAGRKGRPGWKAIAQNPEYFCDVERQPPFWSYEIPTSLKQDELLNMLTHLHRGDNNEIDQQTVFQWLTTTPARQPLKAVATTTRISSDAYLETSAHSAAVPAGALQVVATSSMPVAQAQTPSLVQPVAPLPAASIEPASSIANAVALVSPAASVGPYPTADDAPVILGNTPSAPESTHNDLDGVPMAPEVPAAKAKRGSGKGSRGGARTPPARSTKDRQADDMPSTSTGRTTRKRNHTENALNTNSLEPPAAVVDTGRENGRSKRLKK
ncbi:hypothetical protein M408DRAFT_13165 [Serendipita vermifera MAFF 305830]|uniref:Uncharacterized protein n=1 Tax=Serendipita vermifera MAFF 305830 TaxID=933852 RepID=A0A0C3AJA5_SERVB|nr:hypothetical protein M408DRAFT_13165 [Serendipita vermifera MAFF 305830]